MTVLFFALAALGFGFVIFIHELGHFLFAKWAGVKVEVFSIGFGPRLLTRKIGETEYSLSLLPLGGYVQMTGQEDMPEDAKNPGTAATASDPRSFLNATPAWKAAILLGGVLFNFLSSYAIMLGLAIWGLPVLRPIVAEVQVEIPGADGKNHPSPAAQMGLRPGDRILTLNGEKVRSFEDLATGAIVSGRRPLVLTIQRPGVSEPLTLPTDGTVSAIYDTRVGRPVLGLEQPFSNRVADVAKIAPDLGTPPTGMPRPGERVVAIAGTPVGDNITGQQVIELLHPYFSKSVTVTVEQGGARHDTTFSYVGEGFSGAAGCTLGLPLQITSVNQASPAAEAGMRPGDVVTAIDGIPLAGVEHFYALVRTAMSKSGTCTAEILRLDGSKVTAQLTGKMIAGKLRIGASVQPILRGRLPAIAPALDDKPAATVTAGIEAGDTILNQEPEAGQLLSSRATVIRGGTRLSLPLTEAGRTLVERGRAAGRLTKLFGDEGEPSLAEQLTAVQIEANLDPEGKPTGSPAPGFLVVKTVGGGSRTVDLRTLAADGTTLLESLQRGDWLVGIGPDGAWEVIRGATGAPRTVTLTARRLGYPLVFESEMTPYRLEGPGEVFAIANRETHNMILKSLQFIPKFFTPADQGGLDAKKSLQGPIGIFDTLRLNAEHFGIVRFLNIVAMIGLNLVLVNLLPIPITDGGQLVFLAIETAIGRPLPPLVRTIAAWIGLAMVVALMLFVTTLDIVRRI